MRRRPDSRFPRRPAPRWLPVLAAFSIPLALACASSPAADPSAGAVRVVSVEPIEAPPEPEPDTSRAEAERLYAELEAYTEEFERSLEAILAGREGSEREKLADVTVSLRAATHECLRLAGCDAGRFFAVYDYFLEEQRRALEAQQTWAAVEEAELEEEPVREEGTATFDGSLDAPGRTVTIFNGTDLGELIELNGPVRAALDDWLTWMRPNLMLTWHNYQYLRHQMAPEYERADLPEALLFGMLATESHGKVHSYSRAGAVGPLQFVRATGRRYGLTEVNGFDMRLDPAAATRANVGYMQDLLREFDNSLEKALAAYNGGEYRVRRAVKRAGVSSFWDRRVYYQFPRETREYVPRVLAAALLFMDPAKYNLYLPPLETDSIALTVQAPISLGELAVCLGQDGSSDGWFRTLRNLNPRLKPGDRVEAGEQIALPAALAPVYEETCTDGELLAQARSLHDANYPERPEMIPYTVRSGDTLGKIASRYRCVGLRELAEINRIRPPRYVIRVGQRLQIPSCT